MDSQASVAAFLDEHDLHASPTYRLLDLVAEVGEHAGDATESTAYGSHLEAFCVNEDELGDALFSLLALAEALETSLEKYETRITESGSPDSS